MNRQRLAKALAPIGLGLLLAISMHRHGFAYIDPGTTQVIWTTLAPIIGVLVACAALAIWPIRIAWRFAKSRWKKCGQMPPQSQEA